MGEDRFNKRCGVRQAACFLSPVLTALAWRACAGFNNEVCTFNRWQSYEFVDISGSVAQRSLWRSYYTEAEFDYVVYVIDGAVRSRRAAFEPLTFSARARAAKKWKNLPEKKQESFFDEGAQSTRNDASGWTCVRPCDGARP